MAAQGRKNVHGKTGVRFKAAYTASKHKSYLRNVVTDLIVHGEVKVTSGEVKNVKKLADRLVTWGKKGDLHSRRLAAEVIRPTVTNEEGKTGLQILFGDIAPKMASRNGGYLESYKLGARRGDNAEVVLLRWAK